MYAPPPKRDIDGVEVRGDVIIGVQKALDSLFISSTEYLQKFGLNKPNANKWYPLKYLINLFAELEKEGRLATLQKVGELVAENAVWPDDIKTFEDAIHSIEHAYHMNHRRNGAELYDYVNKIPVEGYIGHDILEVDAAQKTAVYVCTSFYPCDFDLGMARALARKFKPPTSFIRIKHDDSKSCRKHGSDSCTYLVSW